uniref:Uncharacterized protein n=1 Tax=Anopheles culicifacies TaxID=139723 RepID=A0A182MPQ1_9DIPT
MTRQSRAAWVACSFVKRTYCGQTLLGALLVLLVTLDGLEVAHDGRYLQSARIVPPAQVNSNAEQQALRLIIRWELVRHVLHQAFLRDLQVLGTIVHRLQEALLHDHTLGVTVPGNQVRGHQSQNYYTHQLLHFDTLVSHWWGEVL